MTKQKYQGIYKIRNLLNGKVYIGQSSNLAERLKDHKKLSRRNRVLPLYRAMRKYGIENFEFIILEWVEDISKLNKREQYWLDFYKSYNPDFGYNLCTIAESNRGHKLSKESCLKFSERQKRLCQNPDYIKNLSDKSKEKWENPEYRQHMSDAHKGKPSGAKGKKHSKETKLKMSESKKGRILSEEHRLVLLLANTGRKCKEETKLKIGLANKGRSCSEEQKKKISESLKGHIPWNKGLKMPKKIVKEKKACH